MVAGTLLFLAGWFSWAVLLTASEETPQTIQPAN
jgi:hypothetical protein